MMKKEDKKIILYWEIAGAIFMIAMGSILHFTYAWSGYNPIVGMMSAVNESVWEHLKLGYWSLIFFILIEYWFIRKKANNFCFAKAAGVLALELFIPVFFYAYTAIIGTEILLVDILSYVVGCLICQYISYELLISHKLDLIWNIIGGLILTAIAVILIYFTFKPPYIFIFKEEHSGQYGTEWDFNG